MLLSAGVGSRLMPLTKDKPKCLIDLGHGTNVLSSQMNSLHEMGVKQVTVVVGYLAEQVRSTLTTHKKLFTSLDTIYNPFFASTNNLVSLWLALQRIDEDFICINGDNLFKAECLLPLLHTDEDIVMTISRKKLYDDDDMKVRLDGDSIINVGKDLPSEIVNAESVGIIKYSKKGRDIIFEKLDNMMVDKKNHSVFYLEALNELMKEKIAIKWLEIPEAAWNEIDFHPDVELVRSQIKSRYLEW